MTSVLDHPAPPTRLGREERGTSAVEYGLLIAGIAALIVVAVFAFGGSVGNLFSHSCQQIATTTSNGSDPGCR